MKRMKNYTRRYCYDPYGYKFVFNQKDKKIFGGDISMSCCCKIWKNRDIWKNSAQYNI